VSHKLGCTQAMQTVTNPHCHVCALLLLLLLACAGEEVERMWCSGGCFTGLLVRGDWWGEWGGRGCFTGLLKRKD
jgi:hypothetical protein